MKEPLILQGTVDQLEAAGDYSVLLSARKDMKTNKRFGIGLGVIFGVWAVWGLWNGDGRAIYNLLVLVVLGVVCWRRTTGREAMRTIASRRRDRERYKAKGKYDGNTPFRIEFRAGECRVFFRGVQSGDAIDCRTFRNAMECEEVIWLCGQRVPSLALPKHLFTSGTAEDLRAWLKPYVKEWKTAEIPQSWKERLDKINRKG